MIKKGQILFQKIATSVENNPTPFAWYLLLFLALLSVRLTLEFFSNQRLFTEFDIIHIGLWFIFIVVSFLLQLHFFSGESILKIAKLVITFFSISLTAPILDIIFFQGKGVKMNYLAVNNWLQFLYSYFTIGGASLKNGATPGIRIEIVLLVLACFNYVQIKRKSILWGIIAAFFIYTVLFLSGTVPFFLTKFCTLFNLEFGTDDKSTILLFVLIDFVLIFTAVSRAYPYLVNTLFGSIKWYIILWILCFMLVGFYLARHYYPNNWTLNPTTIFYLPILSCIAICFIPLDKNSIIIFEKALPNSTFVINTTLLLTIVLLSLSLSHKTFFCTILSWSILFVQNSPPLYFSRIRFIRILLNGTLSVSISLVGFCTFGGVMVGFPTYWMLALFIISISVNTVYDFILVKKQ